MRQNNQVKKRKNMASSKNSSSCEQSHSALIDVVILIAVVSACGILLYPCVTHLAKNLVGFVITVFFILEEEFDQAPMVYTCLGLSMLFAGIALCAITVCGTFGKCGRPGCRGLRKAGEFDIQLETEDCVKNNPNSISGVNRKGLFELPRDHHRELEAELKKMAPVNGRAVLVFKGRCGCSIGTMEVPGPKKTRKIKK